MKEEEKVVAPTVEEPVEVAEPVAEPAVDLPTVEDPGEANLCDSCQ